MLPVGVRARQGCLNRKFGRVRLVTGGAAVLLANATYELLWAESPTAGAVTAARTAGRTTRMK